MDNSDKEIEALTGGNITAAAKAKELLRQGYAINAHQAVSFALHDGRSKSDDWREKQLTGSWRERDWRNKY